jgi:two-component system, NarL family, invasion response regulator UvrY
MRILIIDDHVVVREGVRRLLTALPDTEVFEAASAREALSLYRSKVPDILLLDLNLPNSSGFELLRRLLLENRQVKVIVLSMHAEPIYVARTLNAGARGYVSKTASADELIAAVREVAAGGRYVEREIAAQLVISQYGGANPLEKLTTREIDIVRLLGEGKNFAAIATALGITYKTVANACSIIKGKLGVEHTSDLIRLTYQMRDP